jgi:hypothetical protein
LGFIRTFGVGRCWIADASGLPGGFGAGRRPIGSALALTGRASYSSQVINYQWNIILLGGCQLMNFKSIIYRLIVP